ncbi:ABC-2 type transport system ATP-binding protein [Actinoplanes campanulatus]|uniref:ABC-2 type transport system ATP-binding protein n=1 Tax=Actinoplanes campanulatus TaxID=113559 RepID=A0A7W5FKC6_9ACTN|nr:ABC transporter ATP-binding protein [Actinoplanes campanulatus]MBB3101440.1 ABC-2 type transport system ATP-binding protein [Actinoplanes campanulatus]
MNAVAVHLSRVTRCFGAVRAVDDLDLTIEAGTVVALLGPNGAGKTTTISIMLGLAAPDAGTVTLFDRPAADAVRAGRAGAMLQDAGFVPGATVRDVVDLARALYPHPLDTESILATAGLEGLASRRVDRLSAGETQRARFAFALAGDPDLLVLDEPTTGMDVAARQRFWTAIRAYAADDHTVLFSTHQLHEADDVADRVVVLTAGRIVADGPPAEIRALAGVGTSASLDAAFLALTTGPVAGGPATRTAETEH